jgi:hypothetical protein
LPLKLPKSLQIKVIEQLKANGQSADTMDLISLASDLFSNTLKNLHGMEITNCSLRISSSGKKRSLDHPQKEDKPNGLSNNSNSKKTLR